MYADFFQLSRRPFSATPDPACCYLSSPGLARIYSDIITSIEGQQGIAVVTGEAGIGKSLMVQYLARELQERFLIAYISSCQFPTVRALLQAILFELGQPYQGKTDQELRLELIATLKSAVGESEGTILILDEAHLLSARLLEEVRLLADLAHEGTPLVQILLAGQPALDERLAEPASAPFCQRISVQDTIPLLNRQETMEYVDLRTRHAGQPATELFTMEALLLIAQASDGLPRCINQLCDHSLMLAYVEQAPRVDVEIVRMALEDLQQLPLHWNPTAVSLGPLDSLQSRTTADIEDSDPLLEDSPVSETSADSDLDDMLLDDSESELDFADNVEDPPAAAFEFGAEMESEPAPQKRSIPGFRIDRQTPPTKSESLPIEESPAQKTNPPRTNPPPTPPTPHNSLPAEERIFDRYAILDAGRNPAASMPPAQARPADIRQPSPPTQLRGPMSSSFFEHAAITPPNSDEGSFTSNPLEFLDDVVMPLIEHAQMDELPTRSELDRRLHQFIAAQKSAPLRRPARDLTELEEEIGEEALDLCLELQEDIGHTLEVDPADLPDLSTFDLETPPAFELPGATRTSTEEAADFQFPDGLIPRADAAHTTPPAPKYQFVFSELRKRLRTESRRR